MTTLQQARLLSLLSPRQRREWRVQRCVTEISPTGRVFRLHPRWNSQIYLMTEPKGLRRALLCAHPDLERTMVWDSLDDWKVAKVDIVTGLIAIIRGGDERDIITESHIVSVLPWGIGLTEEEQQWRRDAGRREEEW